MFIVYKKNRSEALEETIKSILEDLYPISSGSTLNELARYVDNLLGILKSFFPMSDIIEEKFSKRITFRYIYHTCRIENNLMTKDDVENLLTSEVVASGKPFSDHTRVFNQHRAVAFIRDTVDMGVTLSNSVLVELSTILSRNLNDNAGGQFRTKDDTIINSDFKPSTPQNILKDINTMISKCLEMKFKVHPVITAAYAHARICTIKPFNDDNGLIARLIMNFILLRHDYPIITISGSRESRLEYFEALERSHTDMPFFVNFIAKCVVKSLTNYIQKAFPITSENRREFFYDLVYSRLGIDRKTELLTKTKAFES